MARVFIGVGHGGADPGAVSETWESADRASEHLFRRD